MILFNSAGPKKQWSIKSRTASDDDKKSVTFELFTRLATQLSILHADFESHSELIQDNSWLLNLLIFDRNNPKEAHFIDAANWSSLHQSNFKSGRPTKIFVHGWYGIPDKGYIIRDGNCTSTVIHSIRGGKRTN